MLILGLEGLHVCHEDTAVLGQFCVEVITNLVPLANTNNDPVE